MLPRRRSSSNGSSSEEEDSSWRLQSMNNFRVESNGQDSHDDSDDDEHSIDWLEEAVLYERDGYLEQAASCIERALEEQDRSQPEEITGSRLHTVAGDIFVEMGDWHRALHHFSRLVVAATTTTTTIHNNKENIPSSFFPDTNRRFQAATWNRIGHCQLQLGQLDQAWIAYGHAWKILADLHESDCFESQGLRQWRLLPDGAPAAASA